VWKNVALLRRAGRGPRRARALLHRAQHPELGGRPREGGRGLRPRTGGRGLCTRTGGRGLRPRI